MIDEFINANIVRSRILLVSSFLCCGLLTASVSSAADKLEITDAYMQGLSDEISKPEYVTQAKEELRESELLEQSLEAPTIKLTQALTSKKYFEMMMRKEFPATYKIYSELPANSRTTVFKRFHNTKKLSMAKRMIIDLYLKL